MHAKPRVREELLQQGGPGTFAIDVELGVAEGVPTFRSGSTDETHIPLDLLERIHDGLGRLRLEPEALLDQSLAIAVLVAAL